MIPIVTCNKFVVSYVYLFVMRLFSLVIGLFITVQLQAQNKSSFSIDQINGEVLLTVSIHSGNFCNGINLMRSEDSLNWEVIGVIAGYCGSISETVTYNYTDEDPILNKTSYYRADLNGLESTEVRSILVLDFEGKEYILTTNPVTAISYIYFNNAPNSEVTLNLYTYNGQIAHSETTTDAQFEINASEHQNGTYIFTIQDDQGNKLATGRVMIRNI